MIATHNLHPIKNIPLKIYLQMHILPKYDQFDKGHDRTHALKVADFAVMLAKKLNVDPDIVYAISLLHDVGLEKDRDFHHVHSKKFVLNSKFLSVIFSKEELKIIADAVEDHRASHDKIPRTIYGKIIADSDRSDFIKIEDWFGRTWRYRENFQPIMTDDEIFEEMWKRLQVSFGDNGTVEFILPETAELLSNDLIRTKKFAKNKKATYALFLELRKKKILKRIHKYEGSKK